MHKLGCLKLYKTTFKVYVSRENVQTKVYTKLVETSMLTILNKMIFYVFVNNFSNFDPKIKRLFLLDSAKAGLLKNVKNHCQEISKTKVGSYRYFYLSCFPLLYDIFCRAFPTEPFASKLIHNLKPYVSWIFCLSNSGPSWESVFKAE